MYSWTMNVKVVTFLKIEKIKQFEESLKYKNKEERNQETPHLETIRKRTTKHKHILQYTTNLDEFTTINR